VIKISETPTKIILDGDLKVIKELQDRTKYRPNGYHMADTYQLYRKSGGQRGWDGYRRIIDTKTRPFAARGHLGRVQDELALMGVETNMTAVLRSPFEFISIEDIPDDLLDVPLDENQWALQKRCIHALLQRSIGRVKVTVSGGKTALFCAIASYVKRSIPEARFLYLTPNERLVTQVYAESKKFLKGWDIGKFGGGGQNFAAEDMIVATAAILGRRHAKLTADKWYKSFHCLLVDEFQYAAGNTYQQVLYSCSALFRYGASDTLKLDDPDKNNALQGLLGDVVEGVEFHEVQAFDRVATPTFYIVEEPAWKNIHSHLEHTVSPNSEAWFIANGEWYKGMYLGPCWELNEDGDPVKDRRGNPVQITGLHEIEVDGEKYHIESQWCLLSRKYDVGVIRNKLRNNRIALWAKHFSDQGKQTLIVATRTLHVMVLQAALERAIGPDLVRVLYGTHNSKERDEAFEWFKATPGAVLISPLVKVGVSINEIRAMIVADTVGDWEFANQLVGRAIRRKNVGENTCEIVWFLDNTHPGWTKSTGHVIKQLSTIKGYIVRRGVNTPADIEKETMGEALGFLDLNPQPGDLS
jgi:superfamily II DNA or RNA helicase